MREGFFCLQIVITFHSCLLKDRQKQNGLSKDATEPDVEIIETGQPDRKTEIAGQAG